MAGEIEAFVAKAREKGLSDKQIRTKLQAGGWESADIELALDDLVVPIPPSKGRAEPATTQVSSPVTEQRPHEPIAVVQNLSVRGFEYAIMFISLLISAVAINVLAQKAIYDMFEKANSRYSYGGTDSTSAFMVTVLIVVFPIFAFMFLRLKKAEVADPVLRNDPSRRKWSQFTQLVTFLVGIGYVVGFLFSVINPESTGESAAQMFLNMFVTVAIAGSIFAYCWREDHRKIEQ